MKRLITHWTPKKIGVSLIVATAFLLTVAWQVNDEARPYHHTDGEIVKLLNGNLPIYDNGIFVGSGRCAGCHGIDPVGFANITSEGELVNPTENWRGTMMANSAKDPFWRAKLSHETAVNPGHAQELVNKCTSCHAPIGLYTNIMSGNPNYDISQLPTDSMARDGVNCSACHQQRMDGLGTEFSGSLHFHTDTIWGPYVSEEMDFPIFYQAMQSFVGYTPVGDHKVKQSEMCAACHTLSTHTADLSGNYTGDTFIEQATYHEWLNSSYKTSNDPQVHKECQGCHMPSLNEPVVIASGYSFLPGREPYGQHWLVGGNTFMLELMKNNITPLDLTATATHFNTVIARTTYQLQNQTAEVQLIEESVDQDTAKFTVKITNLAGHKFPSGYPARRAFIEFVVTDDNGNEVFRSGGVDNTYHVIGENSDFEPHYNVITSPDQVQIYEMVMGDVNNNVTTVLERAKDYLKDNRLVPLGFSSNVGGLYDTTKIVGVFNDPDFNYLNGVEGSGTDEVHYHIPKQGWNGNYHVTARLLYQTAPPKYMNEMFTFDTPEINTFRSMYEAQGPAPFEIALQETNIVVTNIHEKQHHYQIFPNPSWDGWVNVQSDQLIPTAFDLYDNHGKWIQKGYISAQNQKIELPSTKGTYLLVIHDERSKKLMKLVRK
jgi:hypothetical protein